MNLLNIKQNGKILFTLTTIHDLEATRIFVQRTQDNLQQLKAFSINNLKAALMIDGVGVFPHKPPINTPEINL